MRRAPRDEATQSPMTMNRTLLWKPWDRFPGPALPLAVWALGGVSLLMDVSSEMIHALLPIYLVSVMGASMEAIGVIEGVAEAIASILKVFSGALSDRLGRRKTLAVAGYGLAALSKPIFPLAGSLGWVAAARFIDRVGKGIRGPPRDALIADVTPPYLRGAGFGLRQSLDTVGAFVGPLIAIALMAASGSFRAVFWVAVLPALLAVALLWAAVDEPAADAAPKPARLPFDRAALRRLGVTYWLVVAVAALFGLARFSEAFLVLRVQEFGLPLALAPLTLVTMNVVYAFAAYPAGVLADRFDRLTVVTIGFFVLIAADLALALAGSLVGAALGVALWGLHLGLTQGVLAALVADAAPADQRGAAFGVFNLVGGVATLIASLVAGGLWDALGPRAAFFGGALACASALVALALAARVAPSLAASLTAPPKRD
jgi:MFS family permease